MTLDILKIIILACSINGNLDNTCYSKVLACNDEYFSTMLRPIEARSLADCIETAKKGD
jgi:hypothetical protein